MGMKKKKGTWIIFAIVFIVWFLAKAYKYFKDGTFTFWGQCHKFVTSRKYKIGKEPIKWLVSLYKSCHEKQH